MTRGKNFKTIALLLLAVSALFLASCLEAKKETAVSYDPRTDTFRLLKVYYHIYGSSPEELSYLTALYDNRRELIPADIMAILGESVYFRIDAKKYYILSLGEAKPRPAAPAESPIDMKSLGNKPGHFFLTDEGTLAYYHQIEIPGAVIDGLLKEFNTAINKSITESLSAEMKRRREGGKPASWDSLRLELSADSSTATTTPAASQPSLKDNPFMCLDTESLALLLNANNAKRSLLARTGSTLIATLELSAADRRQLVVTWDTIKKKTVDDKAKNAGDPKKPGGPDFMADLVDLVKITSGADTKITGALDLLEVQAAAERLRGAERFKEKSDPNKKADYAMTLEVAKAHGIPIDKDIKLQDILPRFKKGDLPVDNDMKVEPGQGLFSAATQPTN